MTQTPKSPHVIPMSREARRRVTKALNIAVQVAVVASLTLSGGFGLGARTARAVGGGAIWTTTGSCGDPQDANHYQVGDHIFINGSGFAADGYDWSITGKPGGASGDPGAVVASDTQTVDDSGAFCFDAYTVAGDDWGEYQVKFGNKGDNYRVEGAQLGSLVVTKVVDTGSASPDDFTLTISPDPNSVGTVNPVSGSYTFEGLPENSYTVSETPASNYHQVSNTCDDISVTAGQQSTCTIHNARNTRNVTINKEVVGGSALPSDWTFTLSNDEATYTGIHSGDTAEVFTGTYALSENGPSNYSFSGLEGNCYDDGGLFLYTNSEGNTCTVTNTYVPTPANLTIAKTDNHTTANPGEVLTYQITVTNTGTLPANGVRITDTVPNFVTNVTGISDSGTLTTNVVTWDNLTIPGNGSKTVTFDGTVSPSIPAGTTVLHNIALLGCTEFQGCPYLGTATDDTSVTVVAPTLSITKTNDSGSFVNPGATVTYTVVVSNSASSTQGAQSVVLTDALPAGFTYTVSGGSTKSFTLGTINPGASVTTTYAAAVSSLQTAGTYTNTASASASNATTVSATSGVVVKVPAVLGVQSPDLSIQKSADSTFANPGDTLTYTIEVKNVGTSEARNVVVTDTLPNHFAFTDSSGSTRTWNLGTIAFGKSVTFTYTVAVNADATNGTYTNTATVTADGVNPRTDTVDVDVRVPQVLGLATTGPSSFDYALLSLGVLLVAFGAFLLRREHRTNHGGVSPTPRA